MRGLMRWARAVADGDPLEPDVAPRRQRTPQASHARESAPASHGDFAHDSRRRDRLLDQFRVIAEIAEAHRAFAQDTAAPSPEGSIDSLAFDDVLSADRATFNRSPRPGGADRSHDQDIAPDGPRGALGRRRWGHLDVRRLLGRGSFGDVYEAWDTRLERPVALKLLSPVRDPQLVAAALTEARLLARVQHPHVVAIHGADVVDGQVGLWMELIHGRTLDAIVATDGTMSASEATLIGLALCRALAAVHDAGLLHRDVKARNVMRERGGRIVLMDFGAGRAREVGTQAAGSEAASRHAARAADAHPDSASVNDANMDGPTSSGTSPDAAGRGRDELREDAGGDLVGTPLSLAPEIFDHGPASVRSDLYSLGVLLFHLVSGRSPVAGATMREVRASHRAGRRTSVREARPDLPDGFIAAVERALAIDPAERPASAAAFAELLVRAGDANDSGGRGHRRLPPLRMAIAAMVAIPLLVAAGVLTGRTWSRQTTTPIETRLSISMPGIAMSHVAASPNGRRLAITGTDAAGVTRVYLRTLDAFDVRPLAGTEGASSVFWSADGEALGFFAQGKLSVIGASGGPPRVLCDAPNARGGAWNRAGDIVFAPTTDGGLWRIAASGGKPAPLTTIEVAAGDVSHRWPVFMEDGSRLLFLRIQRAPGTTGTFLTTRDGARPRRVSDSASNVIAAGGSLVFAKGPTLVAQRLDANGSAAREEPRVLAGNLAYFVDRRYGLFTWSPQGLLAYGVAVAQVTELTAYNRAGVPLFARRVPGDVRSFALSPDGTRVLLERLDPVAGTHDIWTLDLASDRLSRLTFDDANDTDPVWSADGGEVLFSSDRGSASRTYQLFRRSADAGGLELPLSRGGESKFAEDWSRDGRAILLVGGEEGTRHIYVAPAADPTHPRLLVDSRFLVDEPAFSPDGRLVAYHSTESGQAEVFVTAVADPSARWQVSRGGVQPRWRADGRELYYLSLGGDVMAVRVTRTSPWRAEAPHLLMRAGAGHGVFLNDYAARADGEQFLIKRDSSGGASRLDVVLGWRP